MVADDLNLSLDAGRQVLCLKWADKKLEDIVAWADERILSLDEIPEALFKLSLADSLGKCRDLLSELSKGANEWEALILFLSHDATDLDFEAASFLSLQLYREYRFRKGSLPAGLNILVLYEGSFSLAEDEYHSVSDNLRASQKEKLRVMFLEDVVKFANGETIETTSDEMMKVLGISVFRYENSRFDFWRVKIWRIKLWIQRFFGRLFNRPR